MAADLNAHEVLATFARYGFRKTSMEDVARAAGRSRQAIYNRFGSKEAVLFWAVEEIAAQNRLKAVDALETPGAPLDARLLEAFDTWAGRSVSLIRNTPHGAELAAAAKSNVTEGVAETEAVFRDALRAALEADLPASAADAALTLYFASKGLLMTAADQAAYRDGMAQAIRAVLRT